MGQDQYFISYEWKPNLKGEYCYHQHASTDWFLVFLLKFLWLKHKYKIVDVEYRSKQWRGI